MGLHQGYGDRPVLSKAMFGAGRSSSVSSAARTCSGKLTKLRRFSPPSGIFPLKVRTIEQTTDPRHESYVVV
jgi:hypothetical protein